MDALKYLLVLLGLAGIFIGIALVVKLFKKFLSSDLKESKNTKRKLIFGIAGGIVGILILAVMEIVLVYSFVSVGIGSLFGFIQTPPGITLSSNSDPIHGTMTVYGEEITLPCTVEELESKGYSTDYKWSSGWIGMWRSENTDPDAPHLDAYIERQPNGSEYLNVTGSDKIVAIRFKRTIDFEINGIVSTTRKTEVLSRFGNTAYEADDALSHEVRYLYYLGDADLVYRFGYKDDVLYEVEVGTKKFMTRG